MTWVELCMVPESTTYQSKEGPGWHVHISIYCIVSWRQPCCGSSETMAETIYVDASAFCHSPGQNLYIYIPTNLRRRPQNYGTWFEWTSLQCKLYWLNLESGKESHAILWCDLSIYPSIHLCIHLSSYLCILCNIIVSILYIESVNPSAALFSLSFN